MSEAGELEFSSNTVVYEAIQRRFRNAVVNHIRSMLTDAYGEAAASRVAKAFPMWDEIRAAAARSKSTAVVDTRRDDDFDYLDVSHFTALFNNDFDVLVPANGESAESRADVKRQLLNYLREIKTVRDPISHPSASDLDPYDAVRVIDNAMRALRLMAIDDAAEVLTGLRYRMTALAADSKPTTEQAHLAETQRAVAARRERRSRADWKDVDGIIALAEDNGLDRAFRLAVHVADRHGLGARPYKYSLMLTPPANRGRVLINLKVKDAEVADVYIHPENWERHIGIRQTLVEEALGVRTGVHLMNEREVEALLHRLDGLLG